MKCQSLGRRSLLGAALSWMLLLAACSTPSPAMLRYDIDACDRCRMTISDPAFAAQLATRTGKVYRFDDPWCLAVFVASGRVAQSDVYSIWVNDHERPETIVPAAEAVFVVSDQIRAPMNGGMAAFQSRASATAFQDQVRGRLETWLDVLSRASS